MMADDITVFQFLQDKPLIWNATCCDTFAPSLITALSAFCVSAATAAEDLKHRKHELLASGYHFVPFSMETSGIIVPSAIALFKEVSRHITDREDDSLAISFLFQRISFAIG